jgi:hypothetical protein
MRAALTKEAKALALPPVHTTAFIALRAAGYDQEDALKALTRAAALPAELEAARGHVAQLEGEAWEIKAAIRRGSKLIDIK